jgi:hypothetical protein
VTAALLREAADRLDALADAATPGEWGVVGPDRNLLNPEPHSSVAHIGCQSSSDAVYIAAMSPTVGKALAAWLRYVADMGEEWGELPESPRLHPNTTYAIAVARAVLGRDA